MPDLPNLYRPKYGDPVPRVPEERRLPISHFCEIMTIWAYKWMTPLGTDGEFKRKEREELKAHWKFIELKIRKSNLLWRMLYLGEAPRIGLARGIAVTGAAACPIRYEKPTGIGMICHGNVSARARTTSPAGCQMSLKGRSNLNCSK